ncbi:MAG: hypothetical protein JO162_04610 [Alphaproteobacteria bacterium]|nr:hypothetical protein [Alphaproteobacteria bacterium]MBV9015532.1 hypothetical protein [Alphaproteobacteria bacterium]MBV9152077.1 hypothetical protein [Alphaproteobacteria bacterium]MBV9586791.1 hypothetical protein [Alphaproteobacteria bacterium]MBV9966019.1 hypothetical protein [Alphaproteobacteria bacterium]
MLALSLRLAWPVSPPLISTDIADFAALGEHALCLSVAGNIESVPASRDGTPQPGNDANHDHSLCCLWHALSGVILPKVDAGVRLARFEVISSVATATDFHPAKLTGTIRARGPPTQV